MKIQSFFFYLLLATSLFVTACQISKSVKDTSDNSSGSNAEPSETQKSVATEENTKNENPSSNQSSKLNDNKENQKSESKSGVKVENRCGWFVNPTPANAWLNDKDGEWIIGVQGGFQAEGDYPDFPDDQWVKTNVNYGYGCACIRGKFDNDSKKILEILSSTIKPLSACKKDASLPKLSVE